MGFARSDYGRISINEVENGPITIGCNALAAYRYWTFHKNNESVYDYLKTQTLAKQLTLPVYRYILLH